MISTRDQINFFYTKDSNPTKNGDFSWNQPVQSVAHDFGQKIIGSVTGVISIPIKDVRVAMERSDQQST